MRIMLYLCNENNVRDNVKDNVKDIVKTLL